MAFQAAVLTFAVLVSGCASRGPVPPIVFPGAGTTPAGASRAVRDLGQSLTELFTEPAAAHAVWGVQVRSLDQHETLYRLNDHTLLNPGLHAEDLDAGRDCRPAGVGLPVRDTVSGNGVDRAGHAQGRPDRARLGRPHHPRPGQTSRRRSLLQMGGRSRETWHPTNRRTAHRR